MLQIPTPTKFESQPDIDTVIHSAPEPALLFVPFVPNPPRVNLNLVAPNGATEPRGVPVLDPATVD